MQQVYNILIATVLSFLVIVGWKIYFEPPDQHKNNLVQKKVIKKEYKKSEEILGEDRVIINSPKVKGSISLQGLLMDDLSLKDYLSDDRDKNVHLLKPHNTKYAYFIDFSWMSQDRVELPNPNTIWEADSGILTPERPVTFSWANSDGITFRVKISIDNKYMFSIEKVIENHSAHDISLASYTTINRNFNDLNKNLLIMHEGPIGVANNRLVEVKYKDVVAKKNIKFSLEDDHGKWFGISDKYWLVTQVLDDMSEDKVYINHTLDRNNDHVFKIAAFRSPSIIKSGSSFTEAENLFAGPKELSVLDYYQKTMNLTQFDRAVDFGILYFITKPIFILLQSFYRIVGNFGLAIILLTLFVRIITLPLSIKSCASMIKIKELQPEMARLKTLYKDDKSKLNKESIALFKKHNVTPVSGCLPTLLQVPVFFALYKVLFITIEMRQAKFFGWIRDLSLPDPANIFTLFGLIEWSPPDILSIGVLPIILGITMSLQQRLSGAFYEDKTQAFMMKSMPFILTVLFATFPSGLVIYWVFNNIITILQQVIVRKYLIYKSFNSKLKKA